MRAALDTNIIAYAEGMGDRERCGRARKLVAELPVERVVLPAQATGELYRVLTGRAGLAASKAREAILGWSDSFDVADSTWTAFQSAIDLATDHQLQIWDALILSVAAESHCRLLLSEDFQQGFVWRGVSVVNPLAEYADPLLTRFLDDREK
jgi:predicted nucleic acid-binding protein